MTRRSITLLLAVTVALGFAACAEDEVLVDTPSASLPGTRWVVVGLAVDGIGGALAAGAGLTLDFDDAGGVGGSGGCNSYFGRVAFAAGGITVSDLGSTEMACEPDVMEREAQFFEALGRVSTFALDGDRLTLAAGDGTASIDLAPFVPEPDRPLAGTTWVLATLIDGDAASSVVAGTSPTLVIDTVAGTLQGDTGCNHFQGPATFSGGGGTAGTVTMSPPAQTTAPCDPAVRGQEYFVFAVLGGAVAWEIDGTVLRITGADGRALEYRAG